MVEVNTPEQNKQPVESLETHLARYEAETIPKPRTLYTYSKPNLIQDGDVAVFFEGHDSFKQQLIKHGHIYQTKFGPVLHSDIINKAEYGTRVFSTNMRGSVLVLRLTSDLYTRSLPCRT